jgi:hypothetical protein
MLPSTRTLYYLNKARSGFCRVFPNVPKFGFSYGLAEVRGQAGSDRIKQELANKPSTICCCTELNS